ncbi:MAG: 1-acyl-sn-glycerol-3-phosphate acyltransferase [Metallibacterium scheffleri]|jgi:1-acyl-sn-glycerol-3-phosphate acyltransferase|uniref:lysophospholipid acyltransferase family protein n=1 Tax=Metallibacterium scheffleri TaxID=993689 RepID=UPI0026ED602C|nr:lysophospholipid acyltransferase family protein [Metallibacterium scheffleri]MCK9368332.1 1-acyl-sn-glycerol-3-phosphate acyltransferase [Metallibacterium scheffleri]
MNEWRRKLDYASRVAASGLCFGTFGLACILLSMTVFPLIRLTSPDHATTRRRVRQCAYYAYRFFVGMARRLGMISYEVHGGERLAAQGQLVVANHPSLIDVLLIGARLPQVDCIVKDALQRNPFLRLPLRWADYIPNSTPRHLIDNCVATLRAGNSLLVFPEGTRSVPGQPLQMKRGAAYIALAAGADLLPVTIVCRPSSLTKADVWYRVPRCRPHWCLTVGEPIRLADLVVPGEPAAHSARRVTAHLETYFGARIGLSAMRPAAAAPSRGARALANPVVAL